MSAAERGAHWAGERRGAQLVRVYGGAWPTAWQTTVGSVWRDVADGLWSADRARSYLVGLWLGVTKAHAEIGF